MEILFVSHKYPPSVGGMEKQSYELIEGMRRHAVVHSIILSSDETRLGFFLTLNQRILRCLKAYPLISAIHFNDGLIAACSVFHRGYSHLRQTVTLHGLDVTFPNYWYRRKILPGFNRFDRIFAVSSATAAACIRYGILPGKVTVIANGVDPVLAKTGQRGLLDDIGHRHAIVFNERPVFLSVGRPVKRKGMSWFIEQVAPSILKDHIIIMVGPLPQKNTFTQKLIGWLPAGLQTQLELLFAVPTDAKAITGLLPRQVNVRHLGQLSTTELAVLLRRADAFLMPNIAVPGDMEGFGLVCLEASLCGAMVFASGIDGIPDAVHHTKNGILLRSGDKQQWAAALNGFIDTIEASRYLKDERAGYTRATFSWARMCSEYAAQFRELLALPKSSVDLR